MARGFERLADRADAPVHHVGRRDDVDAGLGVRQRLLDQRLQGRVVGDVAVGVEQAVLAVAGVGIERDVGDHAELGMRVLERAHRALHQAVGIPGFVGALAFRCVADHREQRDRGNAQLVHACRGLDEQIDTDPFDAGHGLDRLALLFAIEHEHRVDEIVGS